MSILDGLHILGLRASSASPVLGELPGFKLSSNAPMQDPLLARFEALGATCHHYPVIRIEVAGVNDEMVKQQVMNLCDYDKAIVISQHAAQLITCWLDRYWPMQPVGIDYFGVGPTSAQPLRDFGVSVVVPDMGFTSEALLALAALNAVQGEKIIIFRGGQGRELLEHTLKTRGASVDCCELYRRVIDSLHREAIAELLETQTPLILIYSTQVVDALFSVVPEAYWMTLKSLPIIVPSERVASLARRRGFHSVHLAASALAEDVEHSVLDWYTRAQ